MCIHQLKEEINGMDQSDKQLCELKIFLHSFPLPPQEYKMSFYFEGDYVEKAFMTFVNKDGEMIAICEGEILKQLNEKDKL